MRDGWIVLTTFINDLEAQETRGLLQARGLQAIIEVDNCGGMRPHFDYTSGIKLLVPETEADQARELLLDAAQPAGGASWVCGGCGQEVESQFGSCWKCGRDRD